MQTDDNIFMKQKDVEASEGIPQAALSELNRVPAEQSLKIEYADEPQANIPIKPEYAEEQPTTTESKIILPGEERTVSGEKYVMPEARAKRAAFGSDIGPSDFAEGSISTVFDNPLNKTQLAEIAIRNDFLQAKSLLEGKFGFKKAEYIKDYGIVVQKHSDPENVFRKVQININPDNGKLDFDFMSNDEISIDNKSQLFMGTVLSNLGSIGGGVAGSLLLETPGALLGAELGAGVGALTGNPAVASATAVIGGFVGAGIGAIGGGAIGGTAGQKVQDIATGSKSRATTWGGEFREQIDTNTIGWSLGSALSLGYKGVRLGAVKAAQYVTGISGEAATVMKHKPLSALERAGPAPQQGVINEGFNESRTVALGELKDLEYRAFFLKQEQEKNLKDIVAEGLRSKEGLEGQITEIEEQLLAAKYGRDVEVKRVDKLRDKKIDAAKDAKERAKEKIKEYGKTKMAPGYVVDETAAQQTGKSIQVKTEEALGTLDKERKELYKMYKNDIIAADPGMKEIFDATSPSSTIMYTPSKANMARKDLPLYDYIVDIGKERGLVGATAEAVTDANIQSVGKERALFDFADRYLKATPADRIKYKQLETSIEGMYELIKKESPSAAAEFSINPRAFAKKVVENNLSLRTELYRALKGVPDEKRKVITDKILKKYRTGGEAKKITLALDDDLLLDLKVHMSMPEEEARILAKDGTYADLLDFHQVFSDKYREITGGVAKGAMNSRQSGLSEIQKTISDTLAIKNPTIKEMNTAYAQTHDAIKAARTAIVDKSLDETLKRFMTKDGALEMNDVFERLHSTSLKHGHLDAARQVLVVKKEVQSHAGKVKLITENIEKAEKEAGVLYNQKIAKIKSSYEEAMEKIMTKYPVESLTMDKGAAKWQLKKIKSEQEALVAKYTAESKALAAERDNFVKSKAANIKLRDAHLQAIQGKIQKSEELLEVGDASSFSKAAAYSKIVLKGLYGVKGIFSAPEEKILLKKMMAWSYRNEGLKAILDMPFGGNLEAESMFFQNNGSRFRSLLNAGERPDEIRTVISKRITEEKDNYFFDVKQYKANVKEAKRTLESDLIDQAELMRKVNHNLDVAENIAADDAKKLDLQNIKYAAHEVNLVLKELGIDVNKYNKQVWAKQIMKASKKREDLIARLRLTTSTLSAIAKGKKFNEDPSDAEASEAFAVEVLTYAQEINRKRMAHNKANPKNTREMVDTDGIVKFLKEEVGGK